MSNSEGPLITVMAVNCDAPDWIRLFVLSVRLYTKDIRHEIIVVDNGSLEVNKTWLRAQPDVRLIELPTIEQFHAGGMDIGTRAARGRYVCILDSDAHVQREGWAKDLIALYHHDERVRLIGIIGPDHKPLHPPLFFFERDFIVENGISWRHCPSPDRPHDTDTAQQAYWDIIDLGYAVFRLAKGEKVYQGISWYDQIWINGKPTFAHMWYGTRFQESNPARTKRALDGILLDEHLKRKAEFMSQPLVREILGSGADV